MGLLIAVMLFTYLISKTVNDAKTDRELARQGVVSPRLTAKYGTSAKEKTERYGFADFLADAWSDNWRQRTELRRDAHEAARAAGPAESGRTVRWRDRLRAARAAIVAGAQKVAASSVVRKLVDPVPVGTDRAVATESPDRRPAAVDGVVPELWSKRLADGDGWEQWNGAGWVPVAPAASNTRPAAPESTPAVPTPRKQEVDERDQIAIGDDREGTDFRAERAWIADQAHAWFGRCRYPEPSRDSGLCGEPVLDTENHGGWPGNPHCAYHTVLADPARISNPPRPGKDPKPTTVNGEPPMSAPTGEAVNYETTVAELEAIEAEQRKQIEQAQACLNAVTEAKAAIDGMQESYRATATAAGSVNDHLTALHLDGETLGHVGNSADAMPPSAVDNMYDQLEVIEAAAKTQRDNAEVALASTEAALATVHAKYGDAHATVAGELGGDSRFLDSAATAAPQPVGAGV